MEGVAVTEEGVLSVEAVASSIHSTSVLSRGPIWGGDITGKHSKLAPEGVKWSFQEKPTLKHAAAAEVPKLISCNCTNLSVQQH